MVNISSPFETFWNWLLFNFEINLNYFTCVSTKTTTLWQKNNLRCVFWNCSEINKLWTKSLKLHKPLKSIVIQAIKIYLGEVMSHASSSSPYGRRQRLMRNLWVNSAWRKYEKVCMKSKLEVGMSLRRTAVSCLRGRKGAGRKGGEFYAAITYV